MVTPTNTIPKKNQKSASDVKPPFSKKQSNTGRNHRGLSTIGSGHANMASYMSVYQHPVLKAHLSRSLSRSAMKRKVKKQAVTVVPPDNAQLASTNYSGGPPFTKADPLDAIVNDGNSDGKTSHLPSHRNLNSMLSVTSVLQARKLREIKEQDVKKLHNRIALLQAEEEKALKRIEETRIKANMMLENKLE